MKEREEHIEFAMNYCQHYHPRPGAEIGCGAGVDIRKMQRVPTGPKGIKWGPCIGGHTLENPLAVCRHWLRTTREQGEARADGIERSMKKLTIAGPFIGAWRKKEPYGKAEVVECPVCKGRLHLSQAAYNGHVHARCETADCISFME